MVKITVLFLIVAGGLAITYLIVDYQDNQPLTSDEIRTIEELNNKVTNTRGLVTQVPINFAPIVQMNWSQLSAVLTVASIVMGFIYWLLGRAIVRPIIQEELSKITDKMLTKDEFKEFKEAYISDKDTINRRIDTGFFHGRR